MIISSQILHQIADTSIPKNKRAQLRCQLAKELEDIGNYEAAREAMGELWPGFGERPVLDELDQVFFYELVLSDCFIWCLFGSVKQIEKAQELAKNLIGESITRFEELEQIEKIAEAQMEIGYCYWREGALNDSRAWLYEALGKLAKSKSETKAVTLLRTALVEKVANRLSDALRLHIEAAPLFDASNNNTIKGRFHNEYAQVLRKLSAAEHRTDYIDRALIEYEAASYYFELAGHRRYQACVENNIGYLFYTIKKFPEAHRHLDRAQALFTSLKDNVHTAQVDDTRARVLLAEGRISEAEKLVRSAVQTLEKGGEQCLLVEALTTHGLVLARLDHHKVARLTLQRAVEVAQNVGDSEAAGLASLIILEELAEHLPAQDLSGTYDRAAEFLSNSENRESKDRLLACSRRVLFLVSSLPSPPTWKGFNFIEAVRRYESRLIERALRDAGVVVARAAQLLSVERRSLDAMLRRGRHRALAPLRTPVEPRRRSLMFRDEVDCPDTRAVSVLHVEDDALVADFVNMTLSGEGWSVETCANGAAALERLQSGARYDILIFDNRLPDTNGLELIRQTRALAHRQQTPIIMLSGDELEIQARRAGANAFLRKPEDVSVIAETIARLLARKSRQN